MPGETWDFGICSISTVTSTSTTTISGGTGTFGSGRSNSCSSSGSSSVSGSVTGNTNNQYKGTSSSLSNNMMNLSSSSSAVSVANNNANMSTPTPTEKPSHYRYLKEFRVTQCQLFPLHKCTQHRPFTCFNWHFPNQRRRRPVRRRDGTFNYSPDAYCAKYDETTGTCPDGDDCPLLHRTAGDTERRYHLRYFKTCMCVYETDNRGFCTKNGAHCAFAHGENDKRPPVFDIREQQCGPGGVGGPNGGIGIPGTIDSNSTVEDTMILMCNGPNQLDKERNMMVDDPKWQDTSYVLSNYKTEPCKRPPRLCRQGYACPQYHNPRDRRRSPKTYKYRSTPCPNVKHGDEWGEPTLCDDGDQCAYCHTRTEQQFHPEIYKSSKCHDVFTNQYCPRGPFCAFAHADSEMQINRNLPSGVDGSCTTNLADILMDVLPKQEGETGTCGSGSGTTGSNSIGLENECSNNTNPNTNINGLSADFFSEMSINEYTNANSGGNSSIPFGSLSFASAVCGSAIAPGAPSSGTNNSNNNHNNNNNININNHHEKIGIGLGSLDLNGLNGSLNSNTNKLSGIESAIVSNFLGYKENHEISGDMGYSLFPSMGTRTSKMDSPTDKDETYGTGGGGDSSLGSSISGSTKPISIPSPGFFPGYPVGSSASTNSSPMTSSTNNAFNNSVSSSVVGQTTIFNTNNLDQDSTTSSNNLFSNFTSDLGVSVGSPRTSSSNTTINGYGSSTSHSQHSRHSLLNGAGGNLNPIVGSSSSGGNGGSQLITNSTSSSFNPWNTNNSNNSTNISTSSTTIQSSSSSSNRHSHPSSELTYLPLKTLQSSLSSLRYQVEQYEKAISSHDKNSPHYPCLHCKQKDHYRSIVLTPCEHQVLCPSCAPSCLYCPLCGSPISNRKHSGHGQ